MRLRAHGKHAKGLSRSERERQAFAIFRAQSKQPDVRPLDLAPNLDVGGRGESGGATD